MNFKQIDQLITKIWLICMIVIGLISPVFIHRRYAIFIAALCGCAAAFLLYRKFVRSSRRLN